jgi:hypothetical protein
MADVEQYCHRTLLMDRGRLVMDGPPAQVVKHYYLGVDAADTPSPTPTSHAASTNGSGTGEAGRSDAAEIAWRTAPQETQVSNGAARLTRVALHDAEGRAAGSFSQGDVATLYYEFEILQAIERPIAGLVLHDDRNVIVHGKNTLHLQTDVPSRVPRGARLRFRQEVTLAVAAAEYTVEVGLSSISNDDFEQRFRVPYTDLEVKRTRLCMVPAVLSFAVLPRDEGRLTPHLHHGIVDLPGRCECDAVVPPTAE